MTNSNKKPGLTRNGMTLFEILTVIAIMSVLVAIAIPQVRSVSKDRQVREAARVVNSMFNDAIQRAQVVNGGGGVLLVKNDNIRKDIDDGMGGTFNRSVVCSTLFRLRQVDDYGRPQMTDNMQLQYTAMEWRLDIPVPLQSDVIQIGDSITVDSFGISTEFTARIDNVEVVPATGAPRYMRLILDVVDSAGNPVVPGDAGAPDQTFEVTQTPPPNWIIVPDSGNSNAFQDERFWNVERLPRIVESSRLDLPEGYYIFLEHSGFSPNANAVRSRFLDSDASYAITFDEAGGIDRLIDETADNEFVPFGSLNLLVGEYDAKFLTDTSSVAASEISGPTAKPLFANESLWVNIHHSWGSGRVAVNNLPQQEPISSECWRLVPLPKLELQLANKRLFESFHESSSGNSYEPALKLNQTHPTGTRSGMTIIEVLTAMVVAMIGVFGIMILIPFAIKQAKSGLDMDDASRTVTNAIEMIEINSMDRMVRIPVSSVPPVAGERGLFPVWFGDMNAAAPYTFTAGNSTGNVDGIDHGRVNTFGIYSLDPLSVGANGYDRFPPTSSIIAAGFDPMTFPLISEIVPGIYDPATNGLTPTTLIQSQRMFQTTDDIQFGVYDEDNLGTDVFALTGITDYRFAASTSVC